MKILSLGAGVQSSALALMIEKGELPMVDAAIFADTMSEPKEVYEWFDWLKTQVSYPIHIVSYGNLRQDTIDSAQGNGRWNFLTIPVFSISKETGKKGLLKRQCTSNYKIQPVHQQIRKMLGLAKGEKRKKGTHVELWMGISTDEEGRMKPNQINWIENKYPLVEKNMSRQNCLEWFKKNYNKTPPRSACTFCPYKTNKEWKELRDNYPEDWEKVVELDKAIRVGTKNSDNVYLHRTCVPIDQVKLTVQGDLDFDEVLAKAQSCEGMCGL
tara:strand:+ start:100 stop:909 length:810 start_codon:yes stop_codon:yes gene_type:complete